MIKNNDQAYSSFSIFFHWSSVFLVYLLFALGLLISNLDYNSVWYQRVPKIHMSFGMLLLAITVLRLLWRTYSPPPAPLSKNRLEVLLARGAHVLLYLLIFAIVISGYNLATLNGQPIRIFGVMTVPVMPYLQFNHFMTPSTVHALHWWSACSLMSLSLVHALAAFKHHWIDRNRVFLRMLGR